MLVSLKTINKYVSLEGLTPEQIADGLTFAGVEVEEVSRLASGTNLVIGHVLGCGSHPDSNHLHILTIDLGNKYGVQKIVCGAPNARVGLKVIVALVGAKLPGGEIKKSVIRGVESNGMCCSLLELGVEAKYLTEYQQSGIEELPDDAPVGEEDVLGYLNLDDAVLNLKVLANRPDLLSVYNVAREIGAIYNRPVNIPEPQEVVDFPTKIKVGSETSRCTQFSAKEIRHITIKESPKWMQDCLMAMGIRSINNIVDIGNYVMLMTGQPLHMYDADKLPAHELIARDDYEGEVVALDEKGYQVQKDDVVITSNRIPQCLGGVMGALCCAVDDETKNIYIESASFDGASIRHTSNRLGLVSESSQRFVKGTNHFQSEYVLNLAAQLIMEYADGEKCSDIVTYQSETYQEKKISSSVDRINGRLGTHFTPKEIKDVLERLNFKVMMSQNGESLVAIVPSYRLDVTCDADLSEEVIRLLGYENVVSVLPCLDTKLGVLTVRQKRLKIIREYLLDRGLDECLTYSLVSKKEENLFNLLNNEEHYKILNPLTDEREYFRNHILHSLLKAASYNVARQNRYLQLFETGNMISKSNHAEHLAVVLLGEANNRGEMETAPFDFYHMKGLLEGLMEELGIEASRYKLERLSAHQDELHPGKSADLYFQNQLIARFGQLHPNKVNEYDLGKNAVVVLEMNLEPLLEAKISDIKMSPIPRFPSVKRDLAFVVNKETAVKDLIRTIKKMGHGIVNNAEVFDVYEGEHIASNKKSVAISVTYLSLDHTLTEKEVTDVENDIKFELTKSYQAELRS